MNSPKKPTGLKIGSPPPSEGPGNPAFTYENTDKEPTLDETHPKTATFLHLFIVTLGIVSAFIIGGSLLFLKGGGTRSKGLGLFFFIAGGICAVCWLIKLTSSKNEITR